MNLRIKRGQLDGHVEARRFALVLWNHGGGWEPSDIDTIAQEVKSRSYGDREGTERPASPLRYDRYATMRSLISPCLSADRDR